MRDNISVCLSHKVEDDNQLSRDSELRLEKAVSIFYKKSSLFLVTTGWAYRSDLKKPLSSIMSDIAMNKHSISEKNIVELNQAKDTVGEAIFLKKYLTEMGNLREINIITSDWHIDRAEEIFSFIFGLKNPKLLFHSIKGEKKEWDDENKNNSINEFRRLTSNCKPGDFKSIYNSFLQLHPLYRNKEINNIEGF